MGVNRLRQFAVLGIAILLALGSLDCRAAASDEDPGPTKASDDADSGANKRAAGAGKVDPVAAAFKLPKGVSLNAQQQTAYDNLKAAKEPELRQAFDEVQSAKVGASTAQALKKVHECRAEIRKGIDAIVNGTAPGCPRKRARLPRGAGRKDPAPVVTLSPSTADMEITATMVCMGLRPMAIIPTAPTIVMPATPIIIQCRAAVPRARKNPVRLPGQNWPHPATRPPRQPHPGRRSDRSRPVAHRQPKMGIWRTTPEP